MSLSRTEGTLLALCQGSHVSVTEDECRAVLGLATDHEVTGLIVTELRAIVHRGSNVWSTELAQVLEAQYVHSIIQDGLMRAELFGVLDSLRDVPVLVLKGAALASRYYPPGARESRDIDLLVRASDYERARDGLMRLGYRVMEPYDEEIQRRIGKDVGFIRTDSTSAQWSVELHWRLTEPGGACLPEDDVWRQAQRVDGQEGSFFCPRREHMLALLALNLRKQGFARLKTLCDIDRLVRQDAQEMDWQHVHSLAHASGMCALLRHGLRLSSLLLNTPIPPLPPCTRKDGFQARLLLRLAGPDTALGEGRESRSFRAVVGLLPFVSLDGLVPTLQLIWRRVTVSPEIASYRVGRSGMYRSRAAYLVDTASRVVRAVRSGIWRRKSINGTGNNHEYSRGRPGA